MIKIKQTINGFKLYYKNYLFLNHNSNCPCFKIRIGTARYKMRQGAFQIKEKLSKESPLLNFKIISQFDEKMKILKP